MELLKAKKILVYSLVVVLSGLSLGCVHLQKDVKHAVVKTGQVSLEKTAPPAAASDAGTSVQEKLNPPRRVVLDNGLEVILQERHDSPVVAIQIWVKTGSIYEDKYLGSGISHAVEHMLFKNTKNRGLGEIAREIHNAGGELNGYTSWDRIVFHVVLASRYFDTGLDVLGDSVMNSVISETEWQKEQQVILREIDMNIDDPNRYMYRIFWNSLFQTHPYHYPVIGERELFSALTVEDVQDYYQSRFVPNNMILVAVGDFDAAEALEKIKATFADFQPKPLPYVYLPEEPRQIAPRNYVFEKDVRVARLSVGYHTVDIRHPDLYALDVMAMILGQGRSSRLYRNIKDKGLAYSISSWSYTPSQPGVFGISAQLEEENIEKVKSAISEELVRFQRELVNNDELERARQKVISQYYFSGQNVQGKARELAGDYYLTGDLDFSQTYVEGIKKVTAAEIMAVARRYFYPENRTVVAMVPVRTEEAEPAKAETAADFNFHDSFQKFTLKNGITLLVKENFNAPIVSVQTFLLGGVRFEKDSENGIANFMQSMLMRGTRNRDAAKISEELEAMGASLGTHSGYNSCYNQLAVLSQDFTHGVEILADVVKNPTFPEEEIEKTRKDVLAAIKQQDEEIFSVASKLYRETYFTDHPYKNRPLGTKEAVEKIDSRALFEFYRKIYQPQRLVITVAGAVKAERARKVIEEYFEGLAQAPLVEVAWKAQAPPSQAKEAVRILPGKKQAILMLGFPGISLKDQDVYAFEVMSAILSGQGNRLFQELRDKLGLAYYVGTFNIIGLEAGSYVFYIGAMPENIVKSEAAFWSEIEKIKREPVTPEELSRAKKALVGQKEINLQTNGSQAFSAGLDECYGLGYDNLDKYAGSIEKVSAADILRIARKYFKKEHSVKIVVKPQE